MDRHWSFSTHRLRKGLLLARRLLFLEETAMKSAHLSARILVDRMKERGVVGSLGDVEFQVYSQWGDDGIVQYLAHHARLAPGERSFIEFGVQDYREATTRFLLVNDNWRGLVFDDDPGNLALIRRDPIYWKHDLTAARAFVTAENVDALFAEHGFVGDIGLLHIDIDGNDYWVWKAIESVRPVIAIIEYNAVFGGEHAVIVPYDPAFDRSRAHYSTLFYGASLAALCDLAAAKGYAFVGCNTAGNNAYFVRRDRVGALPVATAREGFVAAKFRGGLDPRGKPSYVRVADRLREMTDRTVYDTRSCALVRVGALYGMG